MSSKAGASMAKWLVFSCPKPLWVRISPKSLDSILLESEEAIQLHYGASLVLLGRRLVSFDQCKLEKSPYHLQC